MREVGPSFRRKKRKGWGFTFNLVSWFIQCIMSCSLFALLSNCSVSYQYYITQVQHFLLNWINKPKTWKGLFMTC